EIIMAKKPKYQIQEAVMKICILNEKEYAGELNCLTRYLPSPLLYIIFILRFTNIHSDQHIDLPVICESLELG
ncbi:MAG: hypothetical protein QW292_11260, partial [Candidatus Parvarchaeota archaeon]